MKTVENIKTKNLPIGKSTFKTLMVRKLKHAWKALGSVSYELTTESAKNLKGTRSLCVCKAIKQGEIFTEENIKPVRLDIGYTLSTSQKF